MATQHPTQLLTASVLVCVEFLLTSLCSAVGPRCHPCFFPRWFSTSVALLSILIVDLLVSVSQQFDSVRSPVGSISFGKHLVCPPSHPSMPSMRCV